MRNKYIIIRKEKKRRGFDMHDMFKKMFTISSVKSRSVSPENFSGGKGVGGMAVEGTGKNAARELGRGWKISPSVSIGAHSTFVLCNIKGEGTINHIWMTCGPECWRKSVLKIYWDEAKIPSVCVPLGDFFCQGWAVRSNLSSLMVTVNPAGGLNSYFTMPFRKAAKIEIENVSDNDMILYYQIDYEECEVSDDAGYFHACWHRSNPLEYKKTHVILDNVTGSGKYVGTYIAWQSNNNGWWGEGEVKFYLDGDREFPTICGTGTEDYFGGAWNFEFPQGEYGTFSTAYQGLHQVLKPDGLYKSNTRFSMYRWHITDPVSFSEDIRVEIQALGWRSEGRYLPLKDDISSTAFWYQKEISGTIDTIDRDEMEVI